MPSSRSNYTAKDIAELMFAEVYIQIPRAIISDRDVLFTSLFWTHLTHRLIGIKQKMSSVYHPETDGLTERANRTVGQMLRSNIGPTKDWVTRLPAIEFAIKLTRSESTGYSPFFLNTGCLPRLMVWNTPGKDEYPNIHVYTQRMKLALWNAHDALLSARVKQTIHTNWKRSACLFVTGDLVYVSTKNINLPKETFRKLIPKYMGL